MRRARGLLFLVPALGMAVLLGRDLAQPSRAVAFHGRPAGPPGAMADLPARAGDWAGPISRLRGWAEVAGVNRIDILFAIYVLSLSAASTACLWAFWWRDPSPSGPPRGQGVEEPPDGR